VPEGSVGGILNIVTEFFDILAKTIGGFTSSQAHAKTGNDCQSKNTFPESRHDFLLILDLEITLNFPHSIYNVRSGLLFRVKEGAGYNLWFFTQKPRQNPQVCAIEANHDLFGAASVYRNLAKQGWVQAVSAPFQCTDFAMKTLVTSF
jgi:hypothetical protein